MKKRILAMLTATMMVLGLAACGATDTKDGAGDTSAAGSGSSGDLIKVGIINNDPNESGYRTANDKDMKNMFTKENGYDASFAYSLKNDEQITADKKKINSIKALIDIYKEKIDEQEEKNNLNEIGKESLEITSVNENLNKIQSEDINSKKNFVSL
ncbi:MAG: hypothetical protein SPL66_06280, partial [Lachnospiraceae bacterium]|nr:hypothetical protein [Lachnospiraceae bacterium]